MAHEVRGQIRRSQAITTWGPGALIDLPRHSGIVAGLDRWPRINKLEEIHEARLASKLERITGEHGLRLYAPPAATNDPREPTLGIGVWRFPEWFVVQTPSGDDDQERSRRLVHRKVLDDRKLRFEGKAVVPTRFVRACPRGHIDDLDWYEFAHGPDDPCRRPLWLDERGTTGDLGDFSVRCECKKRRSLAEAAEIEARALGTCNGRRPWLGPNSRESCNLPSRLLIRTAANAYFPQLISVLSLPDRGGAIQSVVAELWDDLQIVEDAAGLAFIKKKPAVAARLAPFADGDVLEAIRERKSVPAAQRPVKQVELDALAAAPEGYGDDVPIDPDFHARRLPENAWRRLAISSGVESVIQVHRLREVLALAGFTRFEPVTPDIHGEYETDVVRAPLAYEPTWFPAIENRGEGVFLMLRRDAVEAWLARPAVKRRLDRLVAGHQRWAEIRNSKREFPGGPYVLLHTLSHLLIQSLAMRCGYPATSIRERVYADAAAGRFGILLFTGSPDAEGTLGGLVQEARHIELHLYHALSLGALCSNDPICAQHTPGEGLEDRWLHGAACHGCTLVAETSCEMRNDYLDRSLVVPTLADANAAFFGDGE